MLQGSHPGYPSQPAKYPGQGLMAKPRRPSAQLRGQASPAKQEVSRPASSGLEQPRTAKSPSLGAKAQQPKATKSKPGKK